MMAGRASIGPSKSFLSSQLVGLLFFHLATFCGLSVVIDFNLTVFTTTLWHKHGIILLDSRHLREKGPIWPLICRQHFSKLDIFPLLFLAENVNKWKPFNIFGLSLGHALHILDGIVLGRDGQPILARNLLLWAKSHETGHRSHYAELGNRITCKWQRVHSRLCWTVSKRTDQQFHVTIDFLHKFIFDFLLLFGHWLRSLISIDSVSSVDYCVWCHFWVSAIH